MVNEEHNSLLTQILELLDTARQASLDLLEHFTNGDLKVVQVLLADLQAVVRSVGGAQEPMLSQLEHAYTKEMLENVADTLDDIEQAIRIGDFNRSAMKIELQLIPFLRLLYEGFYFWGTVYPDKERMDKYYQEEFAKHYQNFYFSEKTQFPYRLSIIIPAYNHLETTRQCIEQLLKETDLDRLNAELILIDHGSSDGTLKYFESLGVGKVIHFKRNVRSYMLAVLFYICQGEYFAFINNDILVTRGWAVIMLKCLESDDKIISAVSSLPNISNLQTCEVPSCAPSEFVAWANEQNKSDPSRWNDRVRLMPSLGIYRTSAVNQLGFADPYFYSMEFWDDDFSFRARRAGWRQVLCADVACYHFGSVTGRDAQKKESTLLYGRELFLKKNGVDPWGNGFCYDYTAIQLFKQLPSPQGSVAVLGLDCGMGDTPLQLRNELRREGRNCAIYQLTCQEIYFKDIEPLSDGAVFSADLTEAVSSAFGSLKFSYACLGRGIAEYEDSEALLEAVAGRLDAGGTFIFFCDNPFYAVRLHALLGFTLPNSEARCMLADPTAIQRQAEKIFSRVQMIAIEHPVNGLREFIKLHYKQVNSQLENRIAAEKYYFLCYK